ncbi:MAG: TetR/AcrR family transcriptional regulator [Bacteroidota bacterium]
MGRKSLEKNRKEKNEKTRTWAELLLPRLQEVNLAQLTMDDIAEKIQKSKSTLYEYFKTKEEVMDYVVEVRVLRLRAYKQNLTLSGEAPDKIYRQFIEMMSQGIKDVSSSFLHQLEQEYPSSWWIVRSFLNELVKDLQLFYQVGMEAGYFRPSSVALLSSLDEFFVTQVITNGDFFAQSGHRLEEIVKDYLVLKFEGLRLK